MACAWEAGACPLGYLLSIEATRRWAAVEDELMKPVLRRGSAVPVPFAIAMAAIALALAVVIAMPEARAAEPQPHVIQNLAEAQWGPAPPVLPPGAKVAVLAGNPFEATAYTLRIQFPAHYEIPAHSHPTDEHVVVVSGSVTFGMGDKLSKGAANKTLAVGGVALMPAGMRHFAYTGAAEATIVLYGQGPVQFNYVDPNDDPRNARAGR